MAKTFVDLKDIFSFILSWEVDVDNGTTVYNALEVKKTVDTKELKEPKKGKVVTKQELQKMMMEMMGGMGGGAVRFNN